MPEGHAQIHACSLANTHTHTHTHTRKAPSVHRAHRCAHTHTHAHIHTYRCTHTYTCTYQHTRTHTHAHTHSHTHTRTGLLPCTGYPPAQLLTQTRLISWSAASTDNSSRGSGSGWPSERPFIGHHSQHATASDTHGVYSTCGCGCWFFYGLFWRGSGICVHSFEPAFTKELFLMRRTNT